VVAVRGKDPAGADMTNAETTNNQPQTAVSKLDDINAGNL